MVKFLSYFFIGGVIFLFTPASGFYNLDVELKLLESLQQDYPYLTSQDVEIEEISHIDLSTMFPDVHFYHVSIWVSDPPKHTVVSIINDELLQFPYDFNKLLAIKQLKIDPENVVRLAYSFALLADPQAIPYLELNPNSITIYETKRGIEKLEFTTYSTLGGLVKRWVFYIQWGQFMEVDETVLKKRVGDYILPDEDYNSFWRTPGIRKIYNLQWYGPYRGGEDISPQWTFTSTRHYVTIRENGTPTPAATRTVTFSVTGFDPSTVCSLLVTSYGGATGDFLRVVDTVDTTGNWSYTWTPSGDTGQASDLAQVRFWGTIGGTHGWINLPEPVCTPR